jgi:hypothetical protein
MRMNKPHLKGYRKEETLLATGFFSGQNVKCLCLETYINIQKPRTKPSRVHKEARMPKDAVNEYESERLRPTSCEVEAMRFRKIEPETMLPLSSLILSKHTNINC